jgi:hypothetical protein
LDLSTVEVSELEDLRNAVLLAIGEIEQATKELVKIGSKGNRSLVFRPNPGDGCKLCSYKDLCPEGTKALSRETKDNIAESREVGVEEGGVSF